MSADPFEIRQSFQYGAELALVDVREELYYGRGHIVPAVNIPLSRLELELPFRVPGHDSRLVFYDDGEGLADRAMAVARDLGYSRPELLDGGLGGWMKQGFKVYNGTHVTGAALAETIAGSGAVARITPDELAAMQEGGQEPLVLDSRPWEDYQDQHIPGATSCHLGELVYRIRDLVGDESIPVVVNCAGRTRSILGAWSLIEAELPNPVYSLLQGTYGWWRSGRELASGPGPRADDVPLNVDVWARERAVSLARANGVMEIDSGEFSRWLSDRPQHSVHLLDVRSREEYLAGHFEGAVHAHGGQLIECSEDWIGVRNARILVLDDDGVRARVVASWLSKLGYPRVAVLAGEVQPDMTETGLPQPGLPAVSMMDVESVSDDDTVIDVSSSYSFLEGHIPGALWLVRAQLERVLSRIPMSRLVVMDDRGGGLATLLARDLVDHGILDALVLEGGLDAWRNAGGEIQSGDDGMLSWPDDVYYRKPESLEDKMRMKREYMDWQTGLDQKLSSDGILTFDI